jgi:ATP-dependent Lon protease
MKRGNICKKNWYKKLSKRQKERCRRRYTTLFDYKKLLPSIPNILDNKEIPTNISRSLIRKIEKLGRLEATLNNTSSDNDDRNSDRDQYESIAEDVIQTYKQYIVLPTIKGSIIKIMTMKQCQESREDDSLSDKLNSRIDQSLYPENIKQLLKDKVENVQNESNSDKYYQWLNIVLTIPLTPMLLKDKFTSIDIMVNTVMKQLNNNIYGMVTVKEELICTLASMFLNPNTRGKSLGLCGPPGVGKTAIVRSMSSSLGLPFFQINIGNLSDVSTLDGHSFTYTKSEPGLIVKALREMKCNSGIVFFDEIDKIGESNKGSDIMSSLIHITDFTQNTGYQDNYVGEIPIDLSNLFFMFSMNDEKNVNKTLLSRIPIINISGYTDKEKEKILVEHLIPDVCKNYNIDPKEISIDQPAIKLLLSYNKKYEGVRELKELLEMLVKRVSLYFHVEDVGNLNMTFKIDNFSKPFTITSEVVKNLLNDTVNTKRNSLDKEKLHSLYT